MSVSSLSLQDHSLRTRQQIDRRNADNAYPIKETGVVTHALSANWLLHDRLGTCEETWVIVDQQALFPEQKFLPWQCPMQSTEGHRQHATTLRDAIQQRQYGLQPTKVQEAAAHSLSVTKRLQLTDKLLGHTGCVNTIVWNETGQHILSGSGRDLFP